MPHIKHLKGDKLQLNATPQQNILETYSIKLYILKNCTVPYGQQL